MAETLRTESERYAIAYEHFDLLVDYAGALLNSQAHRDGDERELWMDRILAKLIVHAMSLRRISPTPHLTEGEVWDIPSMYALARAIMEAHDALAYICIEPLTDEVRLFRLQIWRQHANEQQLRLSGYPGGAKDQREDLQGLVDRGRAALLAHPLFSSLHSKTQGKIKNNDTPIYALTGEKRCEIAGIDPGRYKGAHGWLSSYLHSHPSALHQLWSFQAGSDDAKILATKGLQIATSFLARSVIAARPLFTVPVFGAPSHIEDALSHWAAFMAPH